MNWITKAHLEAAVQDYGLARVVAVLVFDRPLKRLQDYLGDLSIEPGWLWALRLQIRIMKFRS